MRALVIGYITCAFLCLESSEPLFALGGKLDKPTVAFAEGISTKARDQVLAALARDDAKFLDGAFINSWTTLRYGGNTLALNKFLAELVKCPQVNVHVSFKRLTDDCAWRVGHDAHRNRFQVEINPNSEHVEIESIYLPEFASKD